MGQRYKHKTAGKMLRLGVHMAWECSDREKMSNNRYQLGMNSEVAVDHLPHLPWHN